MTTAESTCPHCGTAHAMYVSALNTVVTCRDVLAAQVRERDERIVVLEADRTAFRREAQAWKDRATEQTLRLAGAERVVENVKLLAKKNYATRGELVEALAAFPARTAEKP